MFECMSKKALRLSWIPDESWLGWKRLQVSRGSAQVNTLLRLQRMPDTQEVPLTDKISRFSCRDLMRHYGFLPYAFQDLRGKRKVVFK